MTVLSLDAVADLPNRRCIITVQANIGSTITVYRVSVSGTDAVRGATSYVTTSTGTIFADYELPQNVDISYFVVSGAESTTLDAAGRFDFGGDVIFDLARPDESLLINVESFPMLTSDVSRDVLMVWDREDPIVVSGKRHMPSGTLALITLSLVEKAALEAVLASGNIIAFSPRFPEYGLTSPMYLSVGSVPGERYSPLAKAPERKWALDVQQVKAPSSAYVYPAGNATWGGVLASGSWGALLGRTWAQVGGL